MRRFFAIVSLFLAVPLLGFSCNSTHPKSVQEELAELKEEFAGICNSFGEETGGEAVCMVDFEKETLHLAFEKKVTENETALEVLAVAARTFCQLTLNKGTVYLGLFGAPLKEMTCNGDPS